MTVRIFEKELLQEIVYDDAEGFEVIEEQFIDSGRWSISIYCVFKEIESGKIYGVYYSKGATEMQDEAPFEYEGDEIEVDELREAKLIVTKYIGVNARPTNEYKEESQ